jgi:hypothetical protein
MITVIKLSSWDPCVVFTTMISVIFNPIPILSVRIRPQFILVRKSTNSKLNTVC